MGKFTLRTWRYRCYTCILAVFVSSLLGCAQPPPPKKTMKQSQIETNFASGINASVDFVADETRTFIVLDLTNTKKKMIDVWINQTYSSEGTEVKRRSRVYKGDVLALSKTVRTSRLEPGLTEIIIFEVFDTKGKVIFKTSPIFNKLQGGVNDEKAYRNNGSRSSRSEFQYGVRRSVR